MLKLNLVECSIIHPIQNPEKKLTSYVILVWAQVKLSPNILRGLSERNFFEQYTWTKKLKIPQREQHKA
jgi:hypothetical protein